MQTGEQPLRRKTVQVYTDGACSGNPGPGGWGVILNFMGKKKEMSGHMANTTNNRMELFAVISGLGALKEPCVVEVYTDSTYVADAFNKKWIDKWQANGWKTAEKKSVENTDLWWVLLQLIRKKGHEVTFHKVKGHSDHPENNRCDELARGAIEEYRRLNKPPEKPAETVAVPDDELDDEDEDDEEFEEP